MQNYPFARGKAFFFCNHTFQNPSHNRPGATLDIEPLSRSLERWNFEVHRGNEFNNLSAEDLEEKMRQISRTNFDGYDCLVVVLSSHGAKDVLLGSDGSVSRFDDLFSLFNPINCTGLRNKPKIFFVQACRGGDTEIVVQSDGTRVSLNQDFFFAYSTVENSISFRDPSKGSWFLQCLAENLAEPQIVSTHNLTDLLTKVNCDILDRYSNQRIAQCCSYISQLKRGFKFTNVNATAIPQNLPSISTQGSVRDYSVQTTSNQTGGVRTCRRCKENYTNINTPCKFHNGDKDQNRELGIAPRMWIWPCCNTGDYFADRIYVYKPKPGKKNSDSSFTNDDLMQVNGEYVEDHSKGCQNTPNHY